MSKDFAIPCQYCQYHDGDYCQYCKSVTKRELAAYLRGNVKIYLSERNRAHKQKILSKWHLERVRGLSCREAAKVLGVSAQTVSRARRGK